MKNLTIFLSLLFVSFSLYSLSAQTYDKSKYQNYPEIVDDPDGLYDKGKYDERRFQGSIMNRRMPMTVSLTEPVHFPYQDMWSWYDESFPVQLASGQILMVWIEYDCLQFAHSSDGGLNWSSPNELICEVDGLNHISGVRTFSGRVVAVWRESSGLSLSYSDDNGINWSSAVPITNNGEDRYTTITQTLNGKIWLFYNRWDPSTQSDIYYRTSIDDGLNWSSEQIFLDTPFNERYGTVVSNTGDTLLAFYVSDVNGNNDIYMVTSSDGGATWSAPSPIANSTQDESRPRVLRQSSGNLWMIYVMINPAPILPGYINVDIFYTQSFDGGNTWITPTQFTQYVGHDADHNTDLVSNQPFVSFASWRWAPTRGQQHIWYGLIGTTLDLDPPPAVFNGIPLNIAADSSIDIQAFVDDENAVSDVQMSYTLNGTVFGPIQMFDDGLHNDENPGDNIWGESIGPFQLGDFITYSFSVTDVTFNTVNVEVGSFEIFPIHNIGNVILNFRSNSQLADMGNTLGTNAYWPRVNGDDYLFCGGLWIGWNGLGDYRVTDVYYGNADWNRTDGTSITLAPGISNQDGNVTYDDQLAMSPQIGLQVHQESYQWADPTRDDFIIFQYTIKNTGQNGDLSNLFIALWTDPDLINVFDDLGGYDSQRGLLYLYDSQGIPNGYIGLKLLGAGNMPSTAVIERPLGSDDFAKFNYMTSGFPTLPTDPRDYDMLLAAQPIDELAVDDTNIVAFGLVMGGSLAELQENADTMEVIYNSEVIVRIEDFVLSEIPTKFSLVQNYPNPFNPSTTIKYGIPERTIVELRIYDILGREVELLVSEEQEAGYYEINFNATILSSGIYFYGIKAGSFEETKKMVLMK